MRSVELFVGAGGLGIGIAMSGFRHDLAVERDAETCLTLCENQRLGLPIVSGWNIQHKDVKEIDYTLVVPDPDLVAGGPPCQPFSLGGKHGASSDSRDGFPEAVRAVRELRPRAFLFENVKGLLRKSFAGYFEYIVLQLRYPEYPKYEGESEDFHLDRLIDHHTLRGCESPTYNVSYRLLNAADYGVPQRRERVFLVGIRSDQKATYRFPMPTHSKDALTADQGDGGTYWERHGIAKPDHTKTVPAKRILAGGNTNTISANTLLPWRTVRDAISDLPDPETDPDSVNIPNHKFMLGAKSYAGHTGSPMDQPAKTLKAGDHGVPGGENTLVHTDGTVRYFTIREAARIQTFPDAYVFPRSWSQSMRQLGNAVPVELAKVMARSVAECLRRADDRREPNRSDTDAEKAIRRSEGLLSHRRENIT